jgi:hypothetical protein
MWLTLALEFELAADVLRTAVAPGWNDVGLLAAIIGLRTILNPFLHREIVQVQAHEISTLAAPDNACAPSEREGPIARNSGIRVPL